MRTSHTPGQWIVGHGMTVQFGDKESFLSVGVQGNPWRPVALLSRSADTTKEDEANARLIAAAPALLDALVACMFALGRSGANVTGGPNRTEWEVARDAIAAATTAELAP